MRHAAAWLVTVAICAGIYCLTLASTEPIDFLVGAVLAAIMLQLIKGFMEKSRVRETGGASPPVWLRLIWFFPFCFAVIRDVVIGTWDVLLYSIGLRSFESAGIVRIPIGERTKSGVAISGWALTLAPGSALVDVDWESGEMLVHVLEAEEGDAIRKTYQDFYDRYQRRIFP